MRAINSFKYAKYVIGVFVKQSNQLGGRVTLRLVICQNIISCIVKILKHVFKLICVLKPVHMKYIYMEFGNPHFQSNICSSVVKEQS